MEVEGILFAKELLLSNMLVGLPIIGSIMYQDSNKNTIECAEFELESIRLNKMRETYGTIFGDLCPYSESKYWVSIACGEVVSLLAIDYLDIWMGEDFDKYCPSKVLFDKWVQNKFLISETAVLTSSQKYEFVINHKRVQGGNHARNNLRYRNYGLS